MSAARSVKRGLTPKRERDNSEYGAMVRRLLRAYGRRVGDADEVDLTALLDVRDWAEEAITEAVRGQRRQGHSWAYIGAGLGVTRQAAQMRYGHVDND